VKKLFFKILGDYFFPFQIVQTEISIEIVAMKNNPDKIVSFIENENNLARSYKT
jgi:hypothetical protein